jgi:hypothetical protein
MIWSMLFGWSLEKDETQIRVKCDWRIGYVEVEEFCPYEPSNYCWDPGWNCVDGAGQEFYVSQSGLVFKMPENKEVGLVWYPGANVMDTEYIPAVDDGKTFWDTATKPWYDKRWLSC